ncbi:MAG: hypothetical protein GY719_36745 [bacterium]|nr:hypothetical protein [bacterium]
MTHRSTQKPPAKLPSKPSAHAGKISKLAEALCKAPGGGGPDGDHSPHLWIENLAAGEDPPELAPLDTAEAIVTAADRNNRFFWRRYHGPDKRQGSPKQYSSPCCLFTCLLKGRPEYQGLSGYEAVRLIESTFGEDVWERLELPTHDIYDEALDPRDDVIDQWDKVKPADLEMPDIELAAELAEQYPLASSYYTSPHDRGYLRLLSFCYWLARTYRGEPFFLSYRSAGDHLGLSFKQAGRYVQRAIGDGLLIEQETKTARPWSRGRNLPQHRLAKEYRFNLDAVGTSKR